MIIPILIQNKLQFIVKLKNMHILAYFFYPHYCFVISFEDLYSGGPDCDLWGSDTLQSYRGVLKLLRNMGFSIFRTYPED